MYNIPMNLLSITKNYLVWHYSTAYNDIVHIWWNYIWFVNHLFSVPDVIKSLFAPFKRLQEEKSSILIHPEEFFSNLLVNLIMRMVGFFLRTVIIFMALLGFTMVIIGGLLLLSLWTILPVLIVVLVINGLKTLIL